MKRDDIAEVEFDWRDLDDAKEWAAFMDEKNEGNKTIDLSKDKNVTGFLGHLAAERVFDRYGFAYTTTRTVKFQGGDRFDIQYEFDHIDVKSHRKAFDEKYFYNEDMLVFDHHDRKDENYFCFVRVNPDWQRAFVYGFIHAKRFWEIAEPGAIPPRGRVQKPTPYHAIKSRDLLPARNYILRLWKTDRGPR